MYLTVQKGKHNFKYKQQVSDLNIKQCWWQVIP